MIEPYSVYSTAWVAISTAGKSGSCWLNETNEGQAGTADCRIVHATSTPVGDELDYAKRVYKPSTNNDVMILTADSTSDIFYARCVNSGDAVVLIADMEV